MSLITTYNRSLKSLAKSAGAVLYLDTRQSTGSSRPVNDPLTTPWKDLSGLGNDATPTNMAGTTTSGVDTTDPSKPFWVLDGTDDFFSMVNAASLDITAAPLAVFATIKIGDSAPAGFIFCKNLDASTNIQYSLLYDNTNSRISVNLDGTTRRSGSNGAVLTGTWYNMGFLWDGTNVKAYVNLAKSGTDAPYSGALTSRANTQIGCRGNTAGAKTAFLKGNMATLSIYAGVNATEANILKAEKAISKAYIGV